MKRSQHKIITQQSKILQYMRRSKSISMREAGRRVDLSDSTINHIEDGRMGVSPERIRLIVESYGYTQQEFEEYVAGKAIPLLSIKQECIGLLDRIDETKLRAVHAVLASFTG